MHGRGCSLWSLNVQLDVQKTVRIGWVQPVPFVRRIQLVGCDALQEIATIIEIS